MEHKYMMATKATHALGDMSSEVPDICHITDENADNYIGHWVHGFKSMNLQFPKDTTRELTPEEREKYDQRYESQRRKVKRVAKLR